MSGEPILKLLAVAVSTTLLVAAAAAPASAARPWCQGYKATIVGNDKANVIRGTKKRDVIVAKGGNDRIYGRGGKDIICAGAGKDKVFGGSGADRIRGGDKNDKLWGGAGWDRLDGGKGTDTCYPGAGGGKKVRCELPKPKVLAIAYSNLDHQPGFGSGDVLIAKLVDTNRDGVPSAGDSIFMGKYPTTFTPSGLADFTDWGVTSLVVTDVDLPVPYGEILVFTANGGHEWHGHPASTAEYYSESAGVGVFTSIHDRFGDAIPADHIYTDPDTPSHPGALTLDRTAARDDRFIDVYIYGL